MSNRVLRILPGPRELAEAGAELFCSLAEEALRARGGFAVALSGGSTPKAMFALLANEPYRGRVDWSRIEFFWSDERAVPPEDPESNFGMAREALLRRVAVPPERVHRMPADEQPLIEAATRYEAEVRRVVPAGADGMPRFDLVMLGMGDDGHTASLFPESPALDERVALVAPNYVAKLNAQRMTFTLRLINAAANVLFLAGGASKAQTLAEVLEGPREPRRLPSQLIAPIDGTLFWLVDRAAAAALKHGGDDAPHPLP